MKVVVWGRARRARWACTPRPRPTDTPRIFLRDLARAAWWTRVASIHPLRPPLFPSPLVAIYLRPCQVFCYLPRAHTRTPHPIVSPTQPVLIRRCVHAQSRSASRCEAADDHPTFKHTIETCVQRCENDLTSHGI